MGPQEIFSEFFIRMMMMVMIILSYYYSSSKMDFIAILILPRLEWLISQIALPTGLRSFPFVCLDSPKMSVWAINLAARAPEVELGEGS